MLRIKDNAKSRFRWAFLLFIMAGVPAFAVPNEDILAASKAGDRAGVEAALASGASVNAVDEKGLTTDHVPGLTPLGLAAFYGHKNVAVVLLAQGAKVDATNILGQTPLHQAAMNDSTDVAKLLLDYHANVNARGLVGDTPLAWAALKGHASVATLLLARGALVNGRITSGRTALHAAASEGNAEMVALLLAHGADPNARNSDGQTPLQEMQTATLDDATKASVAAALHATPKVKAQAAAPARVPPPTPAPASPATAQTAVPNCWDIVGIARWVKQANPGIERQPGVLLGAVEQFQITMGCRPAPQQTECHWIGSTWTCKT